MKKSLNNRIMIFDFNILLLISRSLRGFQKNLKLTRGANADENQNVYSDIKSSISLPLDALDDAFCSAYVRQIDDLTTLKMYRNASMPALKEKRTKRKCQINLEMKGNEGKHNVVRNNAK